VTRRKRYTADEYEQVEADIALGLPAHIIGAFLNPPVRGDVLRCAMRRAGIELGTPRGNPSKERRVAWYHIILERTNNDHRIAQMLTGVDIEDER